MEINATFVGQAVAFLIFAYICMKYVWPPLLNALEKRQKEIADGLSAAEKAKKNLELATAGAKETLQKAKTEAQQIIEEANKQRAAIIDKATVEANEEKQKILERAKVEIEAERNKAREELRSEVISLAVAGAEKILNEKADINSDKAALKQVLGSL
ncbi:MAG: F0F1 ATP synthase subunit B [Succinivibrio sp.]|nr:F0F1 ATP synthase subunit B [Succinivibrio sp.]